SSRRRHTRFSRDWSSDVCSSDLIAGSDPVLMLTGPIPSTRKALARAGLKVSDIDLWEINEAFAPIPMVVARELGIDMDRVNVNRSEERRVGKEWRWGWARGG